MVAAAVMAINQIFLQWVLLRMVMLKPQILDFEVNHRTAIIVKVAAD